MRYNGYNGDIEVEGETLTITRSGIAARAVFGKDVAPRVIPLQAINGVRLKPASRLTNGWLQLLVGGAQTPELSTGTAASNADTVLFTHKHREVFDALHEWLLAVVEKNGSDGVDPEAWGVTGGRQAGRFDALAARTAAAADRVQARGEALRDEIAERSGAVRAAAEGRAPAERAAAEERAATTGVLFEGVSHDRGRNAKVTLYLDRLERVQEAKLTSLSRAKQDVEVTPVRAITSVQATKDGLLYTKVTAFASGNNIDFRFGHDEAQRFKDALMKLVLQGPPTTTPPAAAPAQPDVIDQLRKLAELRDAGILSDEEFAAKKTDLLGRL